MEQVLCSICIATFQRPVWLGELLESIANQDLPDDIALEVIVVDNDPEKSAEPVVADMCCQLGLDIRYFVQPVKNISLTRNMTIEHARGGLVLLVDDDEVPEPDWVRAMVGAYRSFDCDGVFGRVESKFLGNPPEWMKSVFLFNRRRAGLGETPSNFLSGNCLIKASLVQSAGGPFKPELGLTGGEDSELFGRLSRQGAKFIFCPDAIVHEYVPESRTTWRWLIARAIRIGNLETRRRVMLGRAPRWYSTAKSAGFGMVYAGGCLAMCAASLHRRELRNNWLLRAFYGLGRISGLTGATPKGY